MTWFYISLKYFTQQQREYLLGVISSITANFNNCSDEEQNEIIYLFSKLPNYTETEMNIVYDFVLRRLINQSFTCLYEIRQGGNFNVEVTKPVLADWSNLFIVVRNDADGTLLSNNFTLANNNEIQYILVENFPYNDSRLYRLRITLEKDSGQGVSNGDAVSDIGYVYVISNSNIDES